MVLKPGCTSESPSGGEELKNSHAWTLPQSVNQNVWRWPGHLDLFKTLQGLRLQQEGGEPPIQVTPPGCTDLPCVLMSLHPSFNSMACRDLHSFVCMLISPGCPPSSFSSRKTPPSPEPPFVLLGPSQCSCQCWERLSGAMVQWYPQDHLPHLHPALTST